MIPYFLEDRVSGEASIRPHIRVVPSTLILSFLLGTYVGSHFASNHTIPTKAVLGFIYRD